MSIAYTLYIMYKFRYAKCNILCVFVLACKPRNLEVLVVMASCNKYKKKK